MTIAAEVSSPDPAPASVKGVPGSTRRAIFDAGIDLFYERGYGATTLRQIAEHVSLQTGSLYNHIKSKEELLFDIMYDATVSLLTATRSALAGVEDSTERVRIFMNVCIRYHGEHKKQIFVGNSELRSLSEERRAVIVGLRDEYEAILRDELQSWSEQTGQVIDVRLAGMAGIAIGTHVATWYKAGGRLSLDQIATTLSSLYSPLHSLPGSSGRDQGGPRVRRPVASSELVPDQKRDQLD